MEPLPRLLTASTVSLEAVGADADAGVGAKLDDSLLFSMINFDELGESGGFTPERSAQ